RLRVRLDRASSRRSLTGPPWFLPYLVLLRVGFALPRTLLCGRCALTAPFHPYLRLTPAAVCFLWHFPSNVLGHVLPDVIRHTALRSSDFPPSCHAAWSYPRLRGKTATIRSSINYLHYRMVAAKG